MRQLSAWFRSHPLTSIFLGIVTFAVSVHLFANWRGEVRWQRYCAEARARGVKMTFAELPAPEIPDAENFAALPMFRALARGEIKPPMLLPKVKGKHPPAEPNAAAGERFDWAVWQKYCLEAGWIAEMTDSPPRDVLRGLEHYAPQFQQWAEWPQRPRCRFPLILDEGLALPAPHVTTFTDAARLYALRMRAHLALGEAAAAGADFRSGFQAYRALREEPLMISANMRAFALSSVLKAVGAGLSDRVWGEAEREEIARELVAVDLWKDYLLAVQSERAGCNWFYDSLAAASPAGRAAVFNFMCRVSGASTLKLGLMPKGMIRDNQLRTNGCFDALAARVSADGQTYDPDLRTPPEYEDGLYDRYYYPFYRLMLPTFDGLCARYVALQTLLAQTRVALALELWRNARGSYPETLAELVPEFLAAVPVDTYSRQPLIYRRAEGGTFLLYGVGENRKDDGGEVDPKLGVYKQRDEVWLYAPTTK